MDPYEMERNERMRGLVAIAIMSHVAAQVQAERDQREEAERIYRKSERAVKRSKLARLWWLYGWPASIGWLSGSLIFVLAQTISTGNS